jgi:putative heme-binding domain-containing protein
VTKGRFFRLASAALATGAVAVALPQGRSLMRAQQPAPAAAPPQAQSIRFTTLPGFSIERVVPTDKLDSYVAMTFDSLGRLVVSKENDHPRLLIDADGGGVFEGEKIISDKVRNCQGLWFEGLTLYGHCAPGQLPAPDEPAQSGLYEMKDTNGDDVTDTFAQLSRYVGGIQEHGPHAIRRGPDGAMTLMLGNNTFVLDETMIDPLSPLRGSGESQLLPALPDGRGFGPSVKEFLHGVIASFDRDTKKYTLLVGGLRNAYDHAFNLEGEVFTFDSDMEWDINMPWYREVRSVHGVPGGNYGYRNGSGKFPPYYLDSLPPLREVERGSPVGVEFYQHHVYPKEFHDAYLEADWSRGRLLWTPLQKNGATYKALKEKDELVHGEPLNITDIEVGPDGFVYFTIGGRLTEGGVFRVRYTAPASVKSAATKPPDGVLALVRQPQPLSSWGWAALEKAKASMGDRWRTELETLARNSSGAGVSGEDRAAAVLLLQRHGPQPGAELLKALMADKHADVRAATVFVAGAQSGDAARAIAAAALKDADPMVKRRAAEALVRHGLSADKPRFAPVADIHALLNSPDRFVRYAGRLALVRTPRSEWANRALAETNPVGAIEGFVALTETAGSDADVEPVIKKQLALVRKSDLSVDNRLRLLRSLQLAAIAVDTVSPELRRQVHDALIGQFPAKDERVSRELALLLAWAGQPEAVAKILAAIPSGEENQLLQIHYVYALRTMPQGWTKAQKTQLMDWFAKAVAWRGGASFPGFVNLLFDESLKFFDESEKKLAYEKVPQFAPLSEAEIAAAAERAAAMRAAFLAAQQPAAGQGNAGAAAGAQRGTTAAGQGAPPASPQTGAQPGTPARRPAAQSFGLAKVAEAANARAVGVKAISREELAEELIFTPQRQAPSPEAGRVVYEKVCAACHRFGSIGTDIGPDLTTISSRFQKKDIVESILYPSKAISDQYDVTMIETTDGEILSGMLVREDAQKLSMRTADQFGRPFEVAKSKIKKRQKSPISMMPEGLVDEFSIQQIAGLIAFMQGTPPK